MQVALLALPIALGTIPTVSASPLTARSLQIGSSTVGALNDHLYSFNVPSTTNVGSIAFQYCANSPLPELVCVPPPGLNLAGASLDAQTTNTGFAFSAVDSSIEKLVINRPLAPMTVGLSSYEFGNIINPTTPGVTTYVRISTYASMNATGPVIDSGSVAFALTSSLQVTAYVPPFLTFCAGVFVTLNCNSVTGFSIDVGELSPGATATGTMQFSGATNDESGYTTYLNGFTMTSGNNVIDPLSNPTVSQRGISQFGLNLRSNSSPSVGLEPVGLGGSAPTPGYGSPNVYKFNNGEAITNSTVPTDFRIFTAAYIVNVAPSQPAGVYVTTMTYTAIASF